MARDERRNEIVEALRDAPAGLDVEELSTRLGLHPNTIRWHLAILGRGGALVSRLADRATRGRPPILYSLSPGAAAENRDDYRLLATMLTGTLAGVPDGPSRAEDAGRAWGRHLLRRPLSSEPVSQERAAREVVELLAEHGFAPEAAPGRIRMRRCPY